MSELLRPQDVAARLAVSVRQVQAMANAGDLPAIKMDGVWRFDGNAVERWIADQKRKRLLSHDSIIAAAKPWHKTKSGIYFLIRDNQVIYVGQALNVSVRIAQHSVQKNFDSWHWIPCARSMLDTVERAYIDALMPELNRDTITRNRRLVTGAV